MSTLSPSLRIGVLRGGPSSEYDISLQSGANVLKILSETHRPIDIFISRDGKWHMQGVEKSPERILQNVDVVWNALHGTYGEGGVQEILERHGMQYTGSDRFSSAIAMNKWMTKEHVILAGVRTPMYVIVRENDSILEKAREIWAGISHPLIIKPGAGGSGLGFYTVDSFSELLVALESVLSQYGNAVVEEYIEGKNISCFIIDNFREQETYTFPLTGDLTKEEALTVEDVAKKIHKMLGLRHYSKSDFIVSPKRGVYFLETNTVPKLHDKSRLLESLKSVGVSVKDFLHHILKLAIYETGI